MSNLPKVESFFSEEDMKFNRKMVDLTHSIMCHGCSKVDSCNCVRKKHIRPKISMFEKRDYDFSSEILESFRKKWGISSEEEDAE